MAIWRAENSMLTQVGVEILNKMKIGGSSITITRIVAGSGRVPESKLYQQTAVSGDIKELTPSFLKEIEGGSEISCYITNEGFTEEYKLNQIGIYITHPDYSGEQLYLICQCDEVGVDVISLQGTTPVRLDYSLFLEHSNSSSITLNVDPTGTVNRQEFEEYKAEVQEDINELNSSLEKAIDEADTSLKGLSDSFSTSLKGLSDSFSTSLKGLSDNFSTFKSGIEERRLITSDSDGNLIISGLQYVSGNTLSVTNAMEHRALSLSIEGRSTYASIPTLTTPIYPVNSKVSNICNSDNANVEKFISFPSVIELRSLGDNYKDTIEWDGAKWWKVQRIAEVTVDGTTVSFGRPVHSNSAKYSRGTIYTLDSSNKVQTFNDALPSSPVLTSHGNTDSPSTDARFYGYLEANSESVMRVHLHILHTAIGLQAGQKDATARLQEITSWLTSQNTAGKPVKVYYVLKTPIVTEISLTEVLEMHLNKTELSCSVEGNPVNMKLGYALNSTDSTTMYILKSLARKTEVATANTFAIATVD